MNCQGCSRKTDNKLDSFDWLCDIPASREVTDFVEVTFKNTRKGYYRNTNGLNLTKGDMVAVEASPGHDIGTVTLVGQLVLLQMKKNHVDPLRADSKRIYRIARPADLEKYEEAKALEHETMLKSRQIAEELKLNMKIGDVEFQGDGNKAIFYYIADERVDFRKLIKVLADTFKVRIEMKQIGARQEAGRIGGIGPCGRPLCCSCWMSNFVSVSTQAARCQEISLNPQKLAGQCAKLKCCLNYEQDAYLEAQKQIPPRDVPLEAKDGTYYHFKTDVFAQTMQYSSDPHMAANIVTLTVGQVREIQEMNKRGEKADSLQEQRYEEKRRHGQEGGDGLGYTNVVGQDDLTRFDKKKTSHHKGKPGKGQQQASGRGRQGGDKPNSAEKGNQNGPENGAQARPEGKQAQGNGNGPRGRDRGRDRRRGPRGEGGQQPGNRQNGRGNTEPKTNNNDNA